MIVLTVHWNFAEIIMLNFCMGPARTRILQLHQTLLQNIAAPYKYFDYPRATYSSTKGNMAKQFYTLGEVLAVARNHPF